MSRMVNTVTGPVPVEQLGVTLTHEHLWFDIADLYMRDCPTRVMSDEIITRENREYILSDREKVIFGYRDNLMFHSVDMIVEELKPCYEAGCRTIVEVTTKDLGRDPQKLREISERSGIQVIMGGGYYHFPALPAEEKEAILKNGKDWLAERMIRDVTEGVDGTGIRCGVIGEIGPTADEGGLTIMHAAAIAQRETGVPVIIHYGPMYALDIFEEEGADVSKVVMGHWGEECPIDEAIARGAWVSFDQFGMNFPGIKGDDTRIEETMRMIEKGYLDRLLVSQDMCWKVRLRCCGGTGFAELLTSTKERLIERGMAKEQWDALLVDNVRRLFA